MLKDSKILKILKLRQGFLDYLVPVVLGLFLAYQFIVPAVAKKIEDKRKVASVAEPVAVKKAEIKKEEKSVPPGTYYNFKSNYSCYDAKKEKSIPSYVNAFVVTATQVCELGDACSSSSKCLPHLPSGAFLASDAASFTLAKKKFVRQKSAVAEFCMMPACAAPPENCKYDEAPPLGDDGCPVGCGTLSCTPKQPESCPALNCAVLPQGCEYDGKAKLDANGCYTGCGAIICDSVNPVDFKCPNISCPVPPENCHYDNSGKLDNLGCKTSCGEIVCDGAKKDQCPASPKCSEPPAGCYYVGEPATDDNGCTIGCGGIACHKNLAPGCAPPKCDPPPEDCRYDGAGTLDFNGCLSSCGNLVCNKTSSEK
jgi:hypothetical protein